MSSSIARNASESPLLALPPEIRERIYRWLLGDRLIHVIYRFGPGEELPYEDNEMLYQSTYGTSGWCHLVCEEDCPEGQVVKWGANDRYTRPAHSISSPERAWKEETLDIRTLRTCRPLKLTRFCGRLIPSLSTFR